MEEMDCFLIIHHGERGRSCNRGRSGAAIIPSPEARAAWELGGSLARHSSNGRVLTVRLTVEGGKSLTVCGAYAPTSDNTSAARQACYEDVSTQTRSENQGDILAVFVDGSASMGVGALPGTWERGGPRALGPWGNRHVNAAGQEMHEWLQIGGLAAARTFFRVKGGRYDTWWHPRNKPGYSFDQVIVRRSHIGRVKHACTYSSDSVASDHGPVYLEIRVGRVQRRQKAVNQTKPANIAAPRDPEMKRAFAEVVGSAMEDWVPAHPAASLEEHAEAFRVTPPAKALEVCGKQKRREEGWFAAHREVRMELVTVRNRT
jgi:exonuclease III